MKARRIIFGVGLLILAGGLVGRKMGVIPNIDIGTIILSALSVILIGDGLRHRNFFLILLPLAYIGMKVSHKFFDIFHGIGTFEALGIAAIAAAGLTVLFGKKRDRIGNSRNRGFINHNGSFGNGGAPGQPGRGFFGGAGGAGGAGTEIDQNRFTQHPGFPENGGEPEVQEYGYPNDDGDNVAIENGFGKLTRYLHSANLKKVKIDNGFGNCIVYYDNVYIDQDGSRLEIDNGFGQVDVYIPPFYRFKMKQDNGFGSINVFGNPSVDPEAPLIDADIDNGMGKVNIYFG